MSYNKAIYFYISISHTCIGNGFIQYVSASVFYMNDEVATINASAPVRLIQ